VTGVQGGHLPQPAGAYAVGKGRDDVGVALKRLPLSLAGLLHTGHILSPSCATPVMSRQKKRDFPAICSWKKIHRFEKGF
jgi:hypothetical protein